MSQEVENILNLQSIDVEVIQLKSDLNKFQNSIKKIEEEKVTVNDSLKCFADELINLNLSQKKASGEIDSLKEKHMKLEVQLNAIKTNKEYTLMLSEIEKAKQGVRDAEDKSLEIMELVENKNLEKNSKTLKCESLVTQIDKRIDEQEQDILKCQNRLKELEIKRKESSANCSGDLYNRYEKYFQKKNSIGLVPLHDNGACGGCHQILPPNTKNEVMKGNMVVCDNCSRLIYWEKTL